MEHSLLSNTSGTMSYHNTWSNPVRFKVIENEDSIEFIYKQISTVRLVVYPPRAPEERIFKIVFSCKDGVWHKSKPIFGKVVPAQEESYKFE